MPPQTVLDLYSDPLTVPTNDSTQWIRLFQSIVRSDKLTLNNVQRFDLLTTLYQFRSLGTVIRNGKLAPLIWPNGKWTCQEEYDDMTQFLKPYANELKTLLQEVAA